MNLAIRRVTEHVFTSAFLTEEDRRQNARASHTGGTQRQERKVGLIIRGVCSIAKKEKRRKGELFIDNHRRDGR